MKRLCKKSKKLQERIHSLDHLIWMFKQIDHPIKAAELSVEQAQAQEMFNRLTDPNRKTNLFSTSSFSVRVFNKLMEKPLSVIDIKTDTYSNLKNLCDFPYYDNKSLNKWARRLRDAFLILTNQAIAVTFNKEDFPK